MTDNKRAYEGKISPKLLGAARAHEALDQLGRESLYGQVSSKDAYTRIAKIWDAYFGNKGIEPELLNVFIKGHEEGLERVLKSLERTNGNGNGRKPSVLTYGPDLLLSLIELRDQYFCTPALFDELPSEIKGWLTASSLPTESDKEKRKALDDVLNQGFFWIHNEGLTREE